MNFAYRITETKDYINSPLKQNYNSTTNMKSSITSQRLDEIRRKYDTPTRKQIKQSNSNSKVLNDKTSSGHHNVQLKKFIKSPTTSETQYLDKWIYSQNRLKELEGTSPSTYLKQNIKSQEEIVFKKIKEMKDSLLIKNYNDKVKINSSYCSKIDGQDIQATQFGQHRVENIDKINSKIQQILNCLRQTQNKSSVIIDKDSKLLGSQYLQNRKNTKTSHILSDQQSFKQQRFQGKILKLPTFYNEKRLDQNQITPTSKLTDRLDNRNNGKVKSFANSIEKSGYKNNKYEMKSGKKLDDEIKKIQSKIQHFEEEKKKLNIDFKPYSYSQSKSSTNLKKRNNTINKFDKQNLQFDIAENQKRIQELRAVVNKDKLQRQSLDSTNKLEIHDKPKQTSSSSPQSQQIQPTQPTITVSKLTQHCQQSTNDDQFIQAKKVQQKEKKSAESSRVSDKIMSEQIRRKTDQGIMERKKKINGGDYQTKEKNYIKKLVERISQQAKLDEIFRNNKIWFQSDLNANKWQKLQKELQQKNITMTNQQIKLLFTITDEENNPFFSAKQNAGDNYSLISSYLECEQHWKKNVFKNFIEIDLSKEEFNLNLLDLEKKGFVVLEDLVRFMNMQTGTFYRNRDFYLIFKRICKEDKLEFNVLMEALCQAPEI